ncbi:hypothetical protein predicted by Glimmer/Critica [Acetobacter senegalensis]|uniref:Uncharacterized protein n=1 Tax=Acetobacter senegalensis TaxID=446692 RepID=A0A0U5EW40_9PROT|nr:hypothetical protein predicted by Glimmer/Critica [Acetobacter senegalensis]
MALAESTISPQMQAGTRLQVRHGAARETVRGFHKPDVPTPPATSRGPDGVTTRNPSSRSDCQPRNDFSTFFMT